MLYGLLKVCSALALLVYPHYRQVCCVLQACVRSQSESGRKLSLHRGQEFSDGVAVPTSSVSPLRAGRRSSGWGRAAMRAVLAPDPGSAAVRAVLAPGQAERLGGGSVLAAPPAPASVVVPTTPPMEDSLFVTPTWVVWQNPSPPPPDHRVILRQLVQLPISRRYCSLSVRMRSSRQLRTELDGLSILDARARADVPQLNRTVPRPAGEHPADFAHGLNSLGVPCECPVLELVLGDRSARRGGSTLERSWRV